MAAEEKNTTLTAQEKRENFWYYHKVKVIMAVIVLLLAIHFIYQQKTQTSYDYEIALITTEAVTPEAYDLLKEKLVQSARDRNGDGKIQINLLTYILESGEGTDPQRSLAVQTQLLSDLDLGRCPVCIYSDEIYTLYGEEGLFPSDEQERILLEDYSKPSEENGNLYISLYDYERIDTKRQPAINEYYDDCRELLSLFKNQ